MIFFKKTKYNILALLLSFFVVQGCTTVQKTISNYDDVDINNYDELVDLSNKRFAYINNISGKMSVNVKIKNESIKSDAHFICKKNEVIRMVLIPFPFVEAARIWFNKDGIYIWDKINSAKIQESYADLSSRLGMEINYQMIESFFLSDVFTKNISPRNNRISYCKKNMNKDGYVLEGKSYDMVYKFLFNNSALPVYTEIKPEKDNKTKMTIKSNGYQRIDNRYIMPSEQNISIVKGNENIFNLVMKYVSININTDKSLNTDINIPEGITSVDLDDISKFF